ncbi:glycosyl hydrolase family 28-related protein [Acidicapsa dinghuensis]|uniref:Glycosyl hydrolase family 28-related protein n=1 Tax=Acidicapsa dinghuensis TaxID=2218256 RepID=A0ABW1EIC4_9BACT|nr:glycosyl hydrolase family 28-related protein [Acidicapsa dinghuensis]
MPFLRALAALLVLLPIASFASESYFPLRPDDPHAVYLEHGNFGVKGDGIADDSDAIQQAINRVQETTYQGIVFIPQGRYRITKTIYVWEGIRLIGFGVHRPVFVLAKNTPGFQEGPSHYMVHFTDRRQPAGEPIWDASEFTFYSGMNNIDFEIEDGNPAAVAVRFHVAQHSMLTHMDFHIGSAKAALEDIGNQASDIHIYGGKYGILTKKTSPAWQFLLMDSSFEGQSVASIHTQEAGMTLIRDQFSHVPVGIEIDDGQVEQLYGRDLRMQDVLGAAIDLGDDKNLRSEVTLERIECSAVPNFLRGDAHGNDGLSVAAHTYVMDSFTAGLDIADDGREIGIAMHHKEHEVAELPAMTASDIPALPPMSDWINVQALGVKGDGGTDDTVALQAAIDKHRVLYLPSGMYRLTGSLRLKSDTVLIGLNPVTTQLALLNDTPAFSGEGAPIPLIIAPRDGHNAVVSIGLARGLGNPRAAGIVWQASAGSMLDDVSFFPGHTAYRAALSPAQPAPTSQARGAWNQYFDTEYPDLWVRDGGGGVFRGLWTHDSFSKAGLLVEDTSTPGSIYQLSCEHHIHNEVEFHNVRKWNIYALQTEEENPAGSEATAAEIDHSQHLLFVNTYMYRVSRNVLPKKDAVIVRDSDDVQFANMKVFSQTRLAFDNSVLNANTGAQVRAHHFTSFVIHALSKPPEPLPIPAAIFAHDATLEKVATGFSNASGLTADSDGHVYFTDAVRHVIYRWNDATHNADKIGEIPGSPMALGFVAPHTLLIMAYEKAVYSLDLSVPDAKPQQVTGNATVAPGSSLMLPSGLHNELWNLEWLLERKGYTFRPGSNTAILSTVLDEPRSYYYAPGSNTAMVGGGTWRADAQASQFTTFAPGSKHWITSEDDEHTYADTLESSIKLTTKLFAERGGTSVVSDTAGNVYIASGEIFIYDGAGQQIGILEVSERPSSLAFGGPDGKTLFIGARGSLYAIRTATPGK